MKSILSEHSSFLKINSNSFGEKVLQNPKPSIVVFGAEWSGSTHLLDTLIGHTVEKYKEKISFFSVNIDEEDELVKQYNIRQVPSLLFFKNKVIEDYVAGLLSKNDLQHKLNILINQSI